MVAQIEILAKVKPEVHSVEEMCAAVASALGGSVTYDDDDDEGEIAGIVYFASDDRLWYAMSCTACFALIERARVSPGDAYSIWHEDWSPCGEGETKLEALRDAGMRLG